MENKFPKLRSDTAVPSTDARCSQFLRESWNRRWNFAADESFEFSGSVNRGEAGRAILLATIRPIISNGWVDVRSRHMAGTFTPIPHGSGLGHSKAINRPVFCVLPRGGFHHMIQMINNRRGIRKRLNSTCRKGCKWQTSSFLGDDESCPDVTVNVLS